MANKIDIGGLAATLAKELSEYTLEIAAGVKEAVTITGKELLKNTRKDAPSKTGGYKEDMAIKKIYDSNYGRRVRWYVKYPHYRLSHLLEKGHALKNGGRVRAYPHIDKNEEIAKKAFEERVKEVIKNGGK